MLATQKDEEERVFIFRGGCDDLQLERRSAIEGRLGPAAKTHLDGEVAADP